MTYEIIYSPSAIRTYNEITDYLFYELGNPQAARNFLDQLRRVEDNLLTFPMGLPVCESLELRVLGIRRVHFRKMNYLVLYRVHGNKIFIDGIYHGSQDYERFLI